MKILFLSQRFLLPMDTGGKIRTGKILEQLTKDHDITLMSNFEQNKDGKYINEINNLCSKFIPVHWEEIVKYTPLFFIRLFGQMFSLYPVSALNDYSSKLRKTLERELNNNQYDLAICDFVQSSLMFKNVKDVPKLLFQHNVESVIVKRHVALAKNMFSRLFWWLQWKKMFFYERKMCKNFDTIIAVSDKDKKNFDLLYNAKHAVAIRTGVDIDYYASQQELIKKNSLAFCGSMDWLPNEDGINYFIDDILPLVKKEIPDISLTVVGRNPSLAMKKKVLKHPEVILTGWVDDIRPYMARSTLVVIPLRIGGGTRMKIFEAMAMGKAVISTTIGAEGLPVINNEHILLADDPAEFKNKIINVLSNQSVKRRLGEEGKQFIRNNFSWQKVCNDFIRICTKTASTFR